MGISYSPQHSSDWFQTGTVVGDYINTMKTTLIVLIVHKLFFEFQVHKQSQRSFLIDCFSEDPCLCVLMPY